MYCSDRVSALWVGVLWDCFRGWGSLSVGGWPGYEIIAFGSLLLASSAFRLLFIYLSRLANGNGNGWLDWNKSMVWMCGVDENVLVIGGDASGCVLLVWG